jgi:ketosteroid isomerase-like protein
MTDREPPDTTRHAADGATPRLMTSPLSRQPRCRMQDPSPFTIASRFNDLINHADLKGLTSMLTDDHVFIDSAGSAISGKAAVVEAWSSFFKAFPDYRNVFVGHKVDGAVVSIEGYSRCSDSRLDGPALWRAVVRQEQIAQWRVYEDTIENRRALGLSSIERR